LKIETNSFFDKITEALNAELPFVAYRHPETNTVKGIFQKSTDLYRTKNYVESGFLFAPFDDVNSAVLFPLAESAMYTTILFDIDVKNTCEQLELEAINAERRHIDLVQKGIDFLKTAGVEKVVLSRKEIIDRSSFNVVEIFKKLLLNYTNAMVYVWFHPKVGLWMGASPETLLKVQDNLFKTMALAGTQSYQGSLDVVWQQKEIQEQQFVTDYIVEKLDKDVTVSDVKTIKAGSLLHLCTTISGKLSREFTLFKLINLLHPTPAVCGLPKDEAKRFILENEGYDREFYTGFFGELNIDNSSNLFVNLRCMQVLSKQLALYIGGGITSGSIPQKEWEETVAKSKVILKVLS